LRQFSPLSKTLKPLVMILPVRGATPVNSDNVVMTRIHVTGT